MGGKCVSELTGDKVGAARVASARGEGEDIEERSEEDTEKSVVEAGDVSVSMSSSKKGSEDGYVERASGLVSILGRPGRSTERP